MSEPTESKRLNLDVDLDPDITQDEMADDAGALEMERARQMLEDVPPHHGS
jgi:hypothetical protein